jgi:hypothetical protein
MQRYKFMFSKNHPEYGGTIHSNMDGSGHEYMKPTPTGTYVDYEAAKFEIQQAKQEGYAQAHKDLESTNHLRFEGTNPQKHSTRQAVIDEYLAMMDQVTPVPLTETQQYQAGVRFMEDKMRAEAATGKKLLNELYHDRARLEREVKRAAAMLKRFIAGLEDDLRRGDLAEIESYRTLIGEATEFANASE